MRLAAAVHGILDEYPPPEALRLWFLRLAGLVRVKHGLGEALQTAAAQDVINETYAPVTAATPAAGSRGACWIWPSAGCSSR